jgi:uncharacterized protein (TIGR02117 family)
LAVALIGLAIGYLGAAFGSLLLTPRAVEPPNGIDIYACDNGVHADLVLPVEAAGVDWRRVFPAEAFAAPVAGFDHMGIGWASRQFYLNTPRWADVRISTALKAILWDYTALRVEYRPRPVAGEDCRAWRVDEAGYRRLAAFVQASLQMPDGRPVKAGPGYGARDAFFLANGRYTIVDTCNQWTGQALRAGGAPVAPWTPFSFLVLWNLPMISK